MAFQFTCVVLVYMMFSVVFLIANAKDDSITKHDDGDVDDYGCITKSLSGTRGVCSSSNLDRLRKIRPPNLSWIQIPSIVNVGQGHYQAIGRVINMKYLKEQLKTQQNFKFDAVRESMDNLVPRLDILADTLYIEGRVFFYGIRQIKIFVRELTGAYHSDVYFSAPNWNKQYKRRVVVSMNGEDGKDGINGPQIDIFCDVVNGIFTITSRAGDGKKGQDDGSDAKGRDSGRNKPYRSSSLCRGRVCGSRYSPGEPGERELSGGDRGNAGKPGNGGDAGRMNFRVREINGKVDVRTCRGNGAFPASTGLGGSALHVRGKNGSIDFSYVVPGWNSKLDTASKRKYPLILINIIRRQAEDLLLIDSVNKKGRNALKFILSLAEGRSDLNEMKKDVKRKLGFLGKRGYDIFGENKMFVPRNKWQSLEDSVEDIKDAAESYENVFNDILSAVKSNQNFQQIASKLSAVTSLEVNAEKRRLEEAKRIADSEKSVYIKSVQQLEDEMSSILTNVNTMLPDVYANTKFNVKGFLAILQGIVGFSSRNASKSVLDVIDSAMGLTLSMIDKQCLYSVWSVFGSIKKWLTFGENYNPLADSYELNFDQLDVSVVPQIMQASLEMNKEKFAAELVCLLDVASRPQGVAEFTQIVESFFAAGAARIVLIAEIMNLDNDIGGYNFDIQILEQSEKAIKDATQTRGTPLSKQLQQNIMDSLLSTYRELQRSFMRGIYELYKAFAFRTLWQGNNPLESFQRLGSESAPKIGRLKEVHQLTELFQRIKELKDKANKCFTYNIYTTDIHRWSFDKVKDKRMFQELASNGHTRFSININDSCTTCYNVRLLKIYIELLGKENQPDSVPGKVYLQVRHLSGSFFRAGDNSTKQYYQPLTAYRNIKFNRFTVSNERSCKESKLKGKNAKTICVTEDDSCWEAMCNHELNKRGSQKKDAFFGMEECQSPFGIYELKIPVDKNLACNADGITNKNCKDLDLTKFTQMNVWTHYVYWAGEYPKGPRDILCRKSQQKERNERAVIDQEVHVTTNNED